MTTSQRLCIKLSQSPDFLANPLKGPAMNDAQNVFLFVFATMMLALVVELWAIAKVLHKISNTLDRHNDLTLSQEARNKEKTESIS